MSGPSATGGHEQDKKGDELDAAAMHAQQEDAHSSGRWEGGSAGTRPPPAWGGTQQQEQADIPACVPDSGFRTMSFAHLSSGSGHALDQAIDAVRQENGASADSGGEEEEDDEDDKSSTQEQVRFMRSLNSLASVSSAEGGGMRALLMATPFAAAELQAADLTPYSSAAPGALTEFLPGPHSSLSEPEQDMYKAMVEELMRDGTLSSDMSALLHDMRSSGIGQGSSSPEERSFVEAHKEKLEGVMSKLKMRLPPAAAQKLVHFDSYGLLDLYNSHHARANSGGAPRAFVGGTAMSQPS